MKGQKIGSHWNNMGKKKTNMLDLQKTIKQQKQNKNFLNPLWIFFVL